MRQPAQTEAHAVLVVRLGDNIGRIERSGDGVTHGDAASRGTQQRHVVGVVAECHQVRECEAFAGEHILDVAVGFDGTVWIGTERGLLVYGDIPPLPEAHYIYLPWEQKP